MLTKIKKFFRKFLDFFNSCFRSRKDEQRGYSSLEDSKSTTYQELFAPPKEIKFKIFGYLSISDLKSYRLFCKHAKDDADIYMQTLLPKEELDLLNIEPSSNKSSKFKFLFLIAQNKIKNASFIERKNLAKKAIENNDAMVIFLLIKNNFNEEIVTQISLKKETVGSLFRESTWRWSPLIYYAALVNSPEILILLLRMNANINEKISIEYDYQKFKRVSTTYPPMNVNYQTFWSDHLNVNHYSSIKDDTTLIQKGKVKVKYTYFTIEEQISEIQNPICRALLWIAYAEDAFKENPQKSCAYFEKSLAAHRDTAISYLKEIKECLKGYQKIYSRQEIDMLQQVDDSTSEDKTTNGPTFK